MLFKIRFVKSKKVQNTPILLYRYFLEFPEKKQFIYNIEFLSVISFIKIYYSIFLIYILKKNTIFYNHRYNLLIFSLRKRGTAYDEKAF